MELMTVSEVAERTGKTTSAIYIAIRKGWLKAETRYGIWLVPEKALADYSPNKPGRPRKTYRLRTDISQAQLAREMGVSRQRVNQIIRKEAHWARNTLNQAVKAGKVVKPDNCERCNATGGKLEAHHPDYSKRLEVLWLCSPCHSLIHPHHHNIYGNGPNGHKGGRPRRDEK